MQNFRPTAEIGQLLSFWLSCANKGKPHENGVRRPQGGALTKPHSTVNYRKNCQLQSPREESSTGQNHQLQDPTRTDVWLTVEQHMGLNCTGPLTHWLFSIVNIVLQHYMICSWLNPKLGAEDLQVQRADYKLYTDFWLLVRSALLTPVLLKGQLYIASPIRNLLTQQLS